MITRQLHKMFQTVAQNTGKRKGADPWMHQPTTAWLPGERSVAELAFDKYAGIPVEDAVVKKGVLFDMRQGDPPKVWGSDPSLAIALKSAYGPWKSSWTDISKVVRLIRDAEDPEEVAYRYFLNIPRATSTSWLTPAEVKHALGPVEVEEDATIAIGFDGSEADDHTAFMGCVENGDVFTIGLWTPKGEPRWREDVLDAIEHTFRVYNVIRAYFDPAWWQQELSHWTERYGSPPILEFWTGQRNESRMAVATGALRTAIVREDDRVTIDPVPKFTDEILVDGRSLLETHFQNARARKRRVKIDDRTEDMHILRKEQPNSQMKIDGAIAAILARRARDDAVKAGEFTVPEYARASW